MRWRSSVVAVGIFAVLFGLAPRTNSGENDGTIRGSVLRIPSCEPVVGVEIVASTQPGEKQWRTKTNNTGSFELTGFPRGEYNPVAVTNSETLEKRLVRVGIEDVFVFFHQRGADPKKQTKKRKPTGSIQGVVTDPSGRPLAGAQATVMGAALMGERTATANECGFYRFDPLAPGDYDLILTGRPFLGQVVKVHAGAFVETALTVDRSYLGCPIVEPRAEVPPELKRKVHFDRNARTLPADSLSLLDNVATLLKGNPAIEIRIEGHTDWVGTALPNKHLSEQWAELVLQYLVRKGVPAQRLRAVGLGETTPAADNKTLEGRALNRRVEFHITKC